MLNLEKKIEQKIDEIGDNYCENKGIILTESDLKCIVYSELLKIKSLNNLKSTNTKEYSTDVKSHYIHTEISWFDKSGRLTLKPDITILNPHSISIKTDNKRSFIFGDNDDIDSISTIILVKSSTIPIETSRYFSLSLYFPHIIFNIF